MADSRLGGIQKDGMMHLVLISDTHLRHNFDVPDGDVLIHAGDGTKTGTLSQVEEWVHWMKSLPHETKIAIAGNHDCLFDGYEAALGKRIMADAGIVYLQDSATTLGDYLVYGSPWQPEFCDWAFNLPRGPALAEKWAEIPDDTNILITHGPPFGVGDAHNGRHLGDGDLFARLRALFRLKLHICGHIHSGYGLRLAQHRFISVNASICDEDYEPTNKPVELDLE